MGEVVDKIGSIDGAEAALRLSVILPARNEAKVLGACLQSLLAQSDAGFALDEQWELIVVDDDSSDGTAEIARAAAEAAGRKGVTVIAAPALDLSERGGFTGKTNACWAAAQQARGAWLLFTDADTVHEPGDLSRALHEAERYGAAMLTYSPRQIVNGFWQRVVMPLVFSELASVYPPKLVSDPASRLAAANGQFLLVEREAYFAVGAHRGVGLEILEDVALAQRFKRAKYGIRFRYAPDALSAHMYRSLPEMIEGWTKNLALLFPQPLWLAGWRVLDLLLFLGLPVIALCLSSTRPPWQPAVIWIVWLRTLWRFYARVARSNFPASDVALSILGVPMFCWLLVRSHLHHKMRRSVQWKGRRYRVGR
ncbi:MAG: glycosyltransferase family 2 protein [Acidobacteriaceae bacterium]|nr:glycosyltransferase family 2 protein [Acidobacteriaceae bacterium]